MTESANVANPTPEAAVLCELGMLGVESEGRWSAVRGERASILLAALGLAGDSGVPTEELIEMIWPSPDQPATARQ